MKRARWIMAALAVAALGATGLPADAQEPPKPATDDGGIADAAGPEATITTNPDTGAVEFVGLPPGDSIDADADVFVTDFGTDFGEPNPGRDLEPVDENPTGSGGTSVTYQQEQQGVPVLAAELRVQTDDNGEVVSAGGEVSKGGTLDVTPAVSATDAQATAVEATASAHGVDPATLSAGAAELWIYDPALLDEPGARRLVWRTEVVAPGTGVIDELVLVDAKDGTIALRVDQVHQVKNRRVCDNANVSGANFNCDVIAPARTEGQGTHAVADVNAAYDLSGATYDYYFNNFQRNSLDNGGMQLVSTVRACPSGESCPYVNVFWSSGLQQMVYGAGFASADDVVAHEFTHAVTEFESGLIYENQSGAINESLSDIFGEYMDLTNGTGTDTAATRWLMGEDLPASIGVIRDMEHPPTFSDPDRMLSPLFQVGGGDSGGVHTNSGVGNKAAFLMADGGTFNGQTITALGIPKSQRIWYEVATNHLGPGSNYANLGNFLNQACNNLVGVDGITVANCTEVSQVVQATEMVIPPPANDNFANAQSLPGASGTTTGTTAGATEQTGEPNHAGNAGGKSIWFNWTALATGQTTIDTMGSNYDTLLGIYVGTAVNSLTTIGSNDDIGGGDLDSRVQFHAVAGFTYRIAVDGFNGASGNVTLHWAGLAPILPAGISGTVTETGTGTPLSGINVAILRSSDFSVVGGATTNGSGNYAATLVPGTYYVYVIDPTGAHVAGFHGAPTQVSVVSQQFTDIDPAVARTRGTISGTVTEHGTGTPLANAWAVVLDGATGRPVVGAQTNGSGQYTIPNLPVGNHLLFFVDPAGAHQTEFYDDSPSPNGAAPVEVTGGGTATANAALTPQTPPSGGAIVQGTVTETGTGTPLSGAFVLALRSNDLGLAAGAVTNASGQYSLGLDAGSYRVGFIDPSGAHAMEWFDNQGFSNLGGAQDVVAPTTANADLARTQGGVTGTVTADGGGALSGVWVLAIGSTGVAGGTTTAGNGTYTINGLPAGPYRVTFIDPTGARKQEYWNNSLTYAGATPVTVTGGATTGSVNAGLGT